MSRVNKIRILLLLVVLLAFGRNVTHDFVDWDDGPLIFNNTNLITHSFPGLLHHWNPFNEQNSSMYNPLVFTFWWIIAFAAQVQSPDILGTTLNPYLFHAASLAVHWACACVVFEILRRLKFRDWSATAGAIIFAVHPIQTESVAWATAMKDLLSGLFAFLTILQYLITMESTGKKRTANYWIMTGFYLAALLSKPSTVTLPLIITAIGRLIYSQSWRELIKWTLPWYAIALVFTVIAARIQHFPHSGIRGTVWERPLVALDAIAFYLGKLVLPIHLTFDYGRNPMTVLTDPALHHPLYWTWIFPLGLALILWRAKQKLLWTAAFIFLFALLPVLGLKPFAFQYYTTVADRYMYIPMLGVAIAVAWVLDRRDARGQPIYGAKMATVVAAIVLVLTGLSFAQSDLWQDTLTLYDSLPNNAKPVHLLVIGQYHDDLAAPFMKQADEEFRASNFARGNEFKAKAMVEYDQAMKYYRTAIKLDPDNTHGFDLLYRDQVFLNQYADAIQTVKAWMAVDSNPNRNVDLAGREEPGALEAMLGMLYLKNHQVPEAVVMLRRSLELKPDPKVQSTLNLVESLIKKSTSRPNDAPLNFVAP